MIYIPKEWLSNYSNLDKVYNILSKLDNDIITEESYTKEMAIDELEQLGERIIIEKIKAQAFVLGA